jgi:hypothetical protein
MKGCVMQPYFTSVAQVAAQASHIADASTFCCATLSNPSMVTGVMRVVCLGLHVAEMLNFSAFRDSIHCWKINSKRVPSFVLHRFLTRDFPGRLNPSVGFPPKKDTSRQKRLISLASVLFSWKISFSLVPAK